MPIWSLLRSAPVLQFSWSKIQSESPPCPGWYQHYSHHRTSLSQFEKYLVLQHPHPSCAKGLRSSGELVAWNIGAKNQPCFPSTRIWARWLSFLMRRQAHAALIGILKVIFHVQRFNLLPVLLEEAAEFSSARAPLVPSQPWAGTHPLRFTGHYLLCSSSQRPAPTSDGSQLILGFGVVVF